MAKNKITIEVNNNKCRLLGPQKYLLKIQKAFKVRHPNAFFLRRGGYVQENWDGKINYITDRYFFKSGLLQSVVDYLEENKYKIKVIDLRRDFDITPKIPKKIGNLKPRPEQLEATRAVVYNQIAGINMPICVINAATNFGKTITMAGIYLSYRRKIPAIVIINDGDLYEQFKKEIPQLIGYDDFGYVRGKEEKWNNFTIIMAQTVSRNINKFKNKLTKYGIVLVDEADLADNKTYKSIISNCYNAVVRVGLSGSIYMSKLKKDEVKNKNLKNLFGEEVYVMGKKEMQDKGYSTPIIVKMFPGSTKPGIKGDWKEEYNNNIIYNENRSKICLQRLKYNIKMGRLPALVVCQFHDHIDLMYRIINKSLGKKYVVKYVHGGVNKKTRKKIMDEFREGKIDILISSFIVKRGKNFPLIKYILNAAAGDSQETVSQIVGRGERKHESKNKTIVEDLFDEGFYLKRHSKHRFIYYKKEGFKVIPKF